MQYKRSQTILPRLSKIYHLKSVRRLYTRKQLSTTTYDHHYLHLPFVFTPLGLLLPSLSYISQDSCCGCSLYVEVFWLRCLCAFSFLYRLIPKGLGAGGSYSTTPLPLLVEPKQDSIRKCYCNKKRIFVWCELTLLSLAGTEVDPVTGQFLSPITPSPFQEKRVKER